jgi:hypothetical protein
MSIGKKQMLDGLVSTHCRQITSLFLLNLINRLDENQEMQMETPARRPTGHLEVDVVFEKLDASKDDS